MVYHDTKYHNRMSPSTVETSFCMLISSYDQYDQFVVLFKTNNLYVHIEQLLAILCIHYDMPLS